MLLVACKAAGPLLLGMLLLLWEMLQLRPLPGSVLLEGRCGVAAASISRGRKATPAAVQLRWRRQRRLPLLLRRSWRAAADKFNSIVHVAAAGMWLGIMCEAIAVRNAAAAATGLPDGGVSVPGGGRRRSRCLAVPCLVRRSRLRPPGVVWHGRLLLLLLLMVQRKLGRVLVLVLSLCCRARITRWLWLHRRHFRRLAAWLGVQKLG